MPRRFKSLAAALREGDGRYNAGQSLYLVVKGGSALWDYQARVDKRLRSHWLGSATGPLAVSLTDARAKRMEQWLANNRAPAIRQDTTAVLTMPLQAPTVTTGLPFGEALDQYLAERAPHWRGGIDGRGARQWRASFKGSILLPLGLAQLNAAVIRDALIGFPPDSRERQRQRVDAVVKFMETGASRPKKPKVQHFASMPYADVPEFYDMLSAVGGERERVARALRWTILTNCRTGETVGDTRLGIGGMQWKEVNGEDWTVPGHRHKSGQDFRIPLTDEMRRLLGERGAPDAYVFGPLEQTRMLRVLQRYHKGLTVHGFRSSFRDWAGEQTSAAREVIEACMAHRVGDTTERSYARSDLFEKRRELMQRWSEFLTSP